MSLADQLRAAIQDSPMPAVAVAKAAGISQPVISRFLQGNDIKLAAADKLATYFGLQLAPSKAKPTKKPAKAAKKAKK